MSFCTILVGEEDATAAAAAAQNSANGTGFNGEDDGAEGAEDRQQAAAATTALTEAVRLPPRHRYLSRHRHRTYAPLVALPIPSLASSISAANVSDVISASFPWAGDEKSRKGSVVVGGNGKTPPS